MNLDVTRRAARVLRILVVCWTSGLLCSHAVVHAVARQAQMVDGAELQHPRIGRTMRHVTRDATVGLHRRMFEREWTLLIGVALDARRVRADSQPRLLQLKTAVRVMAVAASHGAFEHLVMGRHGELVFDFTVTTQAQLRLTVLQ